MGTTNDRDEPKLSRAQVIAQNREAYLQKQKERAKEAKRAYLARPEVQEKLKAQKEKLKARRKEQSARLKAAKKAEKKSLEESRKETRARRQDQRDQELGMMLGRGSNLSEKTEELNHASPPMLTIIKGGKADRT